MRKCERKQVISAVFQVFDVGDAWEIPWQIVDFPVVSVKWNLKKVLVLVLCLAMMASIMVTGAAAAFTDQQDIDSKHQEAVDMSIALNIIEGYPDGSFQPNGNVTRAEMSKIICIALNGGEVPATSIKSTPTFADIKGHWAEGFIEYCYAKGVVAGKSADTFDPSGSVTGSEAAKMLLVALGYNADVERYVGSDWELYVNVQANQDGLYNKLLDIQTAEPLSREHAAQMIWNAIQAYVIDKHSEIGRSDGQVTDVYVKSNTQDMLDKYYDGEIVKGQLVSWSYNEKDHDWDYMVFDGTNAYTVNTATDYTSLIGQKVKAVFDLDGDIVADPAATYDAYGIFSVDSQILFSGIVADLPTLKNDDTSVTFDGVKYKFEGNDDASDVPVYEYWRTANIPYEGADNDVIYAGNDDGFASLAELAGKDAANKNIKYFDSQNFCAIDYDGNNKIDFFFVVPAVIAKVGYVGSDDINVAKTLFDACRDGQTKYKKADVTYYDGIAKDDYVAITPAGATATDTVEIVKLDMINGKVTAKDAPKVTINGETYKLDASYTTTVNAGATLSDAAIYNGFIFDADATGNFNISDYVLVVGMDHGAYGDTVKLLFSDGSKKVVDLNGDYNEVDGMTGQVKTLGGVVIANKFDLCTYETNKDGEYTLSAATTVGTGFDYASDIDQMNSVTAKTYTGSKVGFIDGYTVADDAVIFIRDASNGTKVISGSRLKTMSVGQFAGKLEYVLATNSSSSGKGNVNMAYLDTSETSVKNADYMYGYITGVVEAKNDNNQDIYIVTMFTKDGSITLNTTSRNFAGNAWVATNNAIEYTVDTDGDIDEIYQGAEGDPMTDMVPITGKDADNLWIYGMRVELDDDVIYLLADISEEEGIEVGSLASISTAEEPNPGVYMDNAIILFNDSGDIVFVVYDTENGTDL